MDTGTTDILGKGILLIKKVYYKTDSLADFITNTKTKRAFWWIVVVSLSFLAVLFLNILTPLISDDFAYLFIYGEEARVHSVSDIIQSQINHYYMWGGRSVVHFIAQGLLLLPSFVADLLNSLVYMGYIILIYLHIKDKGKNSLSLFILINLAVWFFQPVIGDTILWITGAANYLWGTFFILLFLLPYRLYEGKRATVLSNIFASAGIFLLGIIAGWTNENTAAAMILIAILFLFYYRSRAWKLPVWSYIGLLGGIIGFLIMILAPGNFERAGGAGSMSLYLLAYRLFNTTLTFFYYCGPLILTCLLMLALYSRYSGNENLRANVLRWNMIYYIAAVAAVYAMLLSPTFPRRALFGVVSFLIIGAGILIYNLNCLNNIIRQFRLSALSVGLLSFVFTFYLATKQIDAYKTIVQEREQIIGQAKEEGMSVCEFERYDGGIYIHGEDPFSAELMSRYYGIKIILNN